MISPTQMKDAREGLKATLLVRHPVTRKLYVNLEPEIWTQIKEAKLMTSMSLEIPPFAALLLRKEKTLKNNYDRLQVERI